MKRYFIYTNILFLNTNSVILMVLFSSQLLVLFDFSVKEPSIIELEEWEAFLNSNITEVMEGDVESLTQLNMVSSYFINNV